MVRSGAASSIFKWVVTGTGHVVFAVDPTWLVVIQGGVEKNAGIDWQINDTSTGVPFQSKLGFVGDLGMQHALDDQWSLAFSFRATIMDYTVVDQSFGANSFGVTFSMHYSR